MSDSGIILDPQAVNPFDNNKFIIAYQIRVDASDFDCVYESTSGRTYQYRYYMDESDNVHFDIRHYPLEPCNLTHFSQKDFEDIPELNDMT